jgi:hypothetical protein
MDSVNPKARCYWIKRSWTRLWWVALNPDEPLADLDSPTYYRAWTRERLITKLKRMHESKANPYEEIYV